MYFAPDFMLPFFIVETIIAENIEVSVKDTTAKILKSDFEIPTPEKLRGIPIDEATFARLANDGVLTVGQLEAALRQKGISQEEFKKHADNMHGCPCRENSVLENLNRWNKMFDKDPENDYNLI